MVKANINKYLNLVICEKNNKSLDNYRFLTEKHFDVIPFLEGNVTMHFTYFFKRFCLFIFRERGKEGQRLGERYIDVREETLIGCLLHMPQPGTRPATQESN